MTGVTYRMVEPHHRRGPIWRVDAEQAGSGHFLDVGSHALDLLDYYLGPIEDVVGTAANVASPYAVEDTIALTFCAPGGARGAMSWNFSGGTSDDTMKITGTDGEIAFPMFVRATLVGALVLAAKRTGEAYDPEEHGLLADLAQRAGLALDALQTVAIRRELEALVPRNRRGGRGVIAN